jgi:ABC-type cobalamin/Fe3+-siderophores transport system ATPase subunit
MSTTVEEIEKTETDKRDKDELLLDSLEIKGYRCFEHLTIEKLGRVNLIVGKNNVGKTALLEALWIYSEGGDQFQLAKIAYFRDERPDAPVRQNFPFERIQNVAAEAFLGRNIDRQLLPENQEYPRHLFFKRPTEIEIPVKFSIGKRFSESEEDETVIVRLEIREHDATFVLTSNDNERLINYFMRSNGLSSDLMAEFWDEISLTNLEDFVVESLKIVLGSIQRVSFIGFPKGAKNRIAVARISEFSEPIPLKSLGEGMNRLLGIALALVNCKDGILLIDEIEVGLHYSVLPDVWKLIFKTAKDLNVQVFATTHSKDCIEAFAQAAVDSPEDGMLVQLIRQGEKIIAKNIEEDRLAEALNYEVEVR